MQELPPYTYFNHAPHLRVEHAAYFTTWRVLENTSDLSPAERTIIADTIKLFHPERYLLFAWVVMNDHIHVLFLPQQGFSVSQLVHSWKSFPANQLQRLHGRKGGVFQKDYYDRAIVSHRELYEKAQYICNNPFKRWPDLKSYEWVGWNSF